MFHIVIRAISCVIVCHSINMIYLFWHIFYLDCNRNCDVITQSDKESFFRFITRLTRAIPKPGIMTSARSSIINHHWIPFYLNCGPCDIKYDYIIKLETFEQDTRWVKEIMFNIRSKTAVYSIHYCFYSRLCDVR